MPAQPSFVLSVITGKCPHCRRGNIFVNKSVFPLGRFMNVNDHCTVCGQQLESKNNSGSGLNYALSFIIFFLNLVWYVPIFGISYKDYSFYYYLITTTLVVVLLQPWLIRLSRIINLYLFIRYDKDAGTV